MESSFKSSQDVLRAASIEGRKTLESAREHAQKIIAAATAGGDAIEIADAAEVLIMVDNRIAAFDRQAHNCLTLIHQLALMCHDTSISPSDYHPDPIPLGQNGA